MKYPSVFIAIVAVWIGVLSIASLDQSTPSRIGLFYAVLTCTAILFLIGFWKRA